jgi:hypothetical protein
MNEDTEKEIIKAKELVEKILRENEASRDMGTNEFIFFTWKLQKQNNELPLLNCETIGRAKRHIQNTEERYQPTNKTTVEERKESEETHKTAWTTANLNTHNNFDSVEDDLRMPSKPFFTQPNIKKETEIEEETIIKIKDLDEKKQSKVRIQGSILNRIHKPDWKCEYLQLTDAPIHEKIRPRVSLTIKDDSEYFGVFKLGQKIDISQATLVKNGSYFNLHLNTATKIVKVVQE